MGDLLWHPSRRLLFAGVGPRTSRVVVEALPHVLSLPVLALELVDPKFYHLDTALVPLDDERVLIHPPAFSGDALSLLERIFPKFLIPPVEEAQRGFACNALSLPGKGVILDQSCPKTANLLENAGFRTYLVDTSEFRKSGGSVFCLKMMLPMDEFSWHKGPAENPSE